MNPLLRKWARKPLPDSLFSYKCMRTSWSQFGEDLLLAQILGEDFREGFYVDVGCFDPVVYSNTYIFYRRGWSGICIDPNPVTAEKWEKSRTRDIMVTAGVASTPGSMFYFQFDQKPACNRLVLETERPALESTLRPDSISRIDVVPLTEILQKHVPAGKRIDLMSIDCEGLDFDVLRSLDFHRFRPRALVIEDHNISPTSEISQFMDSIGMKFVAQAFISKIFVDAAEELPWHGEDQAAAEAVRKAG